jgi:hypothetical protein
MGPRFATWKRLATLYGAVEGMHQAELQRRRAEVQEADEAIGTQRMRAKFVRSNGSGALREGDGIGWRSSEKLRQVEDLKRRRLEEIRTERETLTEGARAQYLASRQRTEQIKVVLDQLAKRIEEEHARRTQALSDDRFLARRRSTDMKAGHRKDYI